MSIEFNPRKKSDDKGVGKINIDGNETDGGTPVNTAQSGTTKKILLGGVAVAGVLGLDQFAGDGCL